MSLPAQPHASEQKDTAKAEETALPATKAVKQDPRSYLVIMLLAIMMLPTGLARAYRGEQSGWTRFWVYVGSNVIMIIPILGQIVGGIALIVLTIMGAVDVFKLRKTTTDAFGHPLVMSEKDKQWAHGFYVYFVVTLVLIALVVLTITAFLGTAMNNYMNNGGGALDFRANGTNSVQQYSEPDAF